MNILIINPILHTIANDKMWPEFKTIKDTMIYGMALGFIKLGHTVTLATCANYKPSRLENYDFDVIFFKSNISRIVKPARLPFSWDFIKYLSNNHQKFDLVVASECFQLYTLAASIICPSKTVIWQEMNLHQRIMLKIPSKIWHNVVVPIFMRQIRCIIPRSVSAKEFISQYTCRVSSQMVDHGIDIDKFPASIHKKRQLISSSRLIVRKGVDGIIRNFNCLHKITEYSDIKLIIAGRGPEESNLRKIVSDNNLNEYVEFVGFLPRHELGKMISESMALLINTSQDLNIVSIPESISAGTPVLTTSLTALSSFINTNKLGIAKKTWTENEMIDIIDNNPVYSENCCNIRNQLSSQYAAQKIIDIAMTQQ
ncbi:glycosyltransferase family 4 protein [Muribaculum intestinale]|uniref:glycosyltransferase family 4 protein n=1 Tax=Muribaculum intestinale TaxID=1796646 RepID=UPI00242B12F0|nr:glycosyltransferase [Muribaculum intestinale]